MLLAGCGGVGDASLRSDPVASVDGSSSAAADSAVCDVFGTPADFISDAVSKSTDLNNLSVGGGPAVAEPLREAVTRLEAIAIRATNPTERQAIEALGAAMAAAAERAAASEGTADLISAWDAFYRRYAEQCGEPIAELPTPAGITGADIDAACEAISIVSGRINPAYSVAEEDFANNAPVAGLAIATAGADIAALAKRVDSPVLASKLRELGQEYEVAGNYLVAGRLGPDTATDLYFELLNHFGPTCP